MLTFNQIEIAINYNLAQSELDLTLRIALYNMRQLNDNDNIDLLLSEGTVKFSTYQLEAINFILKRNTWIKTVSQCEVYINRLRANQLIYNKYYDDPVDL